GLIADVNLPLLLVLTFLAGLFPVLLYHHAVRWRLTSRLNAAERTVAELRDAATAMTKTPESAPMPPLPPAPPLASEAP
ncbi:hypothetical protein ABTE19_21900, partial [Acinetobacter baumannii]